MRYRTQAEEAQRLVGLGAAVVERLQVGRHRQGYAGGSAT